MTEEEMAKEYVDTLLNKDDIELDKFLDENLKGLKLNEKQAGTLLGIIKGVGICSFLAGLKAGRPKWHKLSEKYPEAKEIIKELSKSLFLAKGIVRDLIDDTVDFKESKERAIYCYEQEKFDTYKQAEQFLKENE